MPPGVPPIRLFRTFARNLPMTAAMNGWGGYELSRRLSLSMLAGWYHAISFTANAARVAGEDGAPRLADAREIP